MLTQLESSNTNVTYGFQTLINYDVQEDGNALLEVSVYHAGLKKEVGYNLEFFEHLDIDEVVVTLMKLIIEEKEAEVIEIDEDDFSFGV